ncbi:MAG: AMP-binding protein [Pusillimonas sp.]
MEPRKAFCAPLYEFALRTPAKKFLADAERTLTYRQCAEAVDGIARALQRQGLRSGDRCLLFMANGIDYALAWLAMCRLGVISVPLNQAYRGPILVHQVRNAAARAMIVDERHYGTLAEAAQGLECLERVFCFRNEGEAIPSERARLISGEAPDVPLDAPWPAGHDILSIFYTSGTTGPSKGVLYSHHQAAVTASTVSRYLDADDVFYMVNPMCHVGLPHCLGAVLQVGGALIVRERFSASAFWPEVRKSGATVTMMLGSVANYLNAAAPDDQDRSHGLRKVLMVPVLADARTFCERFGVAVMSWFNMTEVSVPLHTHGFSNDPDGGCGMPREGATVRLVDANDRPVPRGTPGELLVRDDSPWALSPGYLNDAQGTVDAWRNLWFHTGDLCVQDSGGAYHYVDRIKDCIRRRGENVSSHEVESQILTHPDVQEAAVIGVAADVGEQEIQAIVILNPQARVTIAGMLDYLAPRLPHFCLPRFIHFVDAPLPKTETGKVQKSRLRELYPQGRGDREAIGYKVQR